MTDAHDNNDLTKVRMRYGADGYAIYWYCLELIAGDLGTEEKITFELRHDAEVIGHNLKIDSTMVEEIMRFMVGLGLFEQSGNVVTCLKLAKYLEKKSTRNSFIHAVIDKASSLSATLPDKSGTKPDISGPFGLDIDIDLDIDKEVITRHRFAPPTVHEVKTYCLERKNGIDPQAFVDHYQASGWVRGKTKIKDWRACVRTWEKNKKDKEKPKLHPDHQYAK
jgi:hypothetical protein